MKAKTKKLRSGVTFDASSLRTILNSMVEAVFVVDDSGRVTLTNRALDQLLERDARGSRPKKIIQSEPLRVAIRRARKQRVATEAEIEAAIGGRTLTFRAQVSPLPGAAGVVAVLHDVTSLKAADRVRRDFVANAAHELRTPLTAIRGFAETLHNGALAFPDVAPSFIEGILRQTQRLQRLSNDLALLSRAESAEHGYEPSPTDIGAVGRDAVASVASLARSHSVQVVIDIPPEPVVVPLSARALEEVLINLLENAIKYSKTGEEVRLSMRLDGDVVTIDVVDTGIGIPPAYQKRIFERFFRVDKGRSRDDGGSGLGLSIVRHLVQRMGGTIALESAPAQGARFTVRLPPVASTPAQDD